MSMNSPSVRILGLVAGLMCAGAASPAQDSQGPTSPTAPAEVRVETQPGASDAVPDTITFEDALKLARKNSPTFRAALAEYASAHEDKVQSRAGLLPNVNFMTQAIYTPLTDRKGGGTATFLASNGVHEYVSQGNVHEALTWEGLGGLRHAQAAECRHLAP